MPYLYVKAKFHLMAPHLRYRVLIDGVEAATLRNYCEKDIEVEPGEHRIAIEVLNAVPKSHAYKFVVGPDEHLHLTCTSSWLFRVLISAMLISTTIAMLFSVVDVIPSSPLLALKTFCTISASFLGLFYIIFTLSGKAIEVRSPTDRLITLKPDRAALTLAGKIRAQAMAGEELRRLEDRRRH